MTNTTRGIAKNIIYCLTKYNNYLIKNLAIEKKTEALQEVKTLTEIEDMVVGIGEEMIVLSIRISKKNKMRVLKRLRVAAGAVIVEVLKMKQVNKID